jgi:hypothetical protein
MTYINNDTYLESEFFAQDEYLINLVNETQLQK